MNDHTRRAESAGQVDGLSHEFRAAREARRGAYYVLAAIPPLAAIGVVVSRDCGMPDAEPIAYTMLLVVGSLAALRWKVRIDERGISRRCFTAGIFGLGTISPAGGSRNATPTRSSILFGHGGAGGSRWNSWRRRKSVVPWSS
ncbi:MAG TPA: hypothetical protein VGX76_13745 [Pirellulales bacterium]|nr:hypothetical protein [Pirellulales bacterium]